tara:strand:+ start:4330 stop:4824 length:495 start_codon:yes stop_codon:yes gene_type:complete
MWQRGSITATWNEDYKNYPYTNKSANIKDIEYWREQGYTHEKFTGEMFCDQENIPQWAINISTDLGLINCGFTFYKMQTGIIMPKHVDHFETYCDIFDTKRTDVIRTIVALEDWKSGHYFEIENEIIHNYSKGDYIMWDADTPHSAANIGIDDRYTLQITGKKS